MHRLLISPRGLALASLLGAAASAGAAATVSTFTGGDPGEGLDLQGNFTYAVNVGPSGAAGKVGDADFTADNSIGVSVTAENNIATGGWLNATFGDTDNDKNIARVLASIRWAAAPNVVTVKLKVEQGVDYKLQLLFGESCCAGRGYNVILDGVTEVTNFMPGVVQAGDGDFNENKVKFGAVVTHTFKAPSNEYVFILDGPAADDGAINDRNAILNGFTLERLSAVNDSDNDGLPDDQELKFFGNLGQKGTDDFDQDGLTNAAELAGGTSPANADTDGDGLADGAEVSTHKTDPNKVDTDGDSLSDSVELNTHATNPLAVDTDGDTFGDAQELSAGTNPNDKNVKPVLTQIGVFTGADPGEGLDLNGNIIYAIAAGAPPEAEVKVRDADFKAVFETEVAGVTLLAGNTAANWYPANFGDSADDVALAAAVKSIRWSAANSADRPDVNVTIDGLEAGGAYKVQLMFGEQCCNRGFDVFFDDKLVADDFNPGAIHGGINNGKQEAVITRYHFASSTTLVISLDGRTAPFPDHNAILNALTVEKLSGKLDADNDGLPDEWEKLYFGNTTAAGTADTDGDGLTNAQEFADGSDPSVADSEPDGLNDSQEKAAGTSPTNADSDGDGLKDGAEINVHKTNPKLADTDGDNLLDGVEVNVHKSDPTKADSDGDGWSDLIEVFSKTNPADAGSKPDRLIVRPVTGAAPEKGLDFRGNFLYALNIGSVETPKIGDAQFVGATLTDEIPGVTVDLQSEIQVWTPLAELGDSADDDGLELVLASIRHNGAGNTVTLAGLTPGNQYKLQLLFHESCCSRASDVLVNGELIVDEFASYVVQGGIGSTTQGAAIIYTFVATSPDFVLSLDGNTVTTPAYTDKNEILNGLTLEDLGKAPEIPNQGPFKITTVARNGANVTFTFESIAQRTYTLQFKQNLADATWQTVASQKASGASTSLSDAGRPGFWRIRSE